MSNNISPGVYTKIIDLSTYVSVVPATTGFICALTKKGRDNKAIFVGSRNELIQEWGEPNLADFGKNFSQGLYNAYNFLGESGSLWFMRVLPDDAQYANIRLDAEWDGIDNTATIHMTYVDGVTNTNRLNDTLDTDSMYPNNFPICLLYPIGRGDYYNTISIRLTKHANPMYEGVYNLDISERQFDGTFAVVESYNVSFNVEARDDAQDSIYIADVLRTYSNILRANCQLPNGDFSTGYDLVVKNYDTNMGWSIEDKNPLTATLTDDHQEFIDWSSTTFANYSVTAIDRRGYRITGWLGNHIDVDGISRSIEVYTDRALTTRGWISQDIDTNGDGIPDDNSLNKFNEDNESIEYYIRRDLSDITQPFLTGDIVMGKGSDGSIFDPITHKQNSAICSQMLAEGYTGTKDEEVQDRERVFFSMVFDCGYPKEVKDQIVELVNHRRDCVGMLDNGDNANYNEAIAKRNSIHNYNTYLCAIYEGYNKIYDTFTGSDIWVSPLYHMSYLAPRNDNVAEIWNAIAGFQRGAINSIIELRFSPKLGQRDQMYLRQLNPIVKFNIGYSVWGQLTTQAKPSALQDLNIVRLVLYCKEALERYCRFYIFEMNDSLTWSNVNNDIVEFLESVKSRRGLYTYSVEVGANDYEKKSKRFHVNVTLTPTRVTEKIDLNFYIK